MKKFILKITLLLGVGFLCLPIIFFFNGTFKQDEKINFVSNSISFNAKSSFIYRNYSKLAQADYIILGSSMSLNNIDGILLEKGTNKKVINLSSWGMKIQDFKEFLPHLNPNSTIIINLSFTDFSESWIEKYSNYPIGNDNEYFNKMFNFNTYRQQYKQIKEYTSDSSNRNYTCLNFDQTGSVLFLKDQFKISDKRWGDTKRLPTTEELENLLNQLKILDNHKVYLFFSPERTKYKSQAKARTLLQFERNLKKKFNNINFYNLYYLKYSDTMFVDCDHFNQYGANNYTNLILNQVISSKSNQIHQGSN